VEILSRLAEWLGLCCAAIAGVQYARKRHADAEGAEKVGHGFSFGAISLAGLAPVPLSIGSSCRFVSRWRLDQQTGMYVRDSTWTCPPEAPPPSPWTALWDWFWKMERGLLIECIVLGVAFAATWVWLLARRRRRGAGEAAT
jgi:hypothetical protein